MSKGRTYLLVSYRTIICEDELPEGISEELYGYWFELSWVDGVRRGPKIMELLEL